MAATTIRLGIVEEHKNFSGILYASKWYVANSDIPTYTYAPHDDCSTLFDNITCYVKDYDKFAAGAEGVIVKITAYSEGYSFGGGGQIPLQGFDKVYKNYDVGQFHFHPSFWGLRQADDNDVKNSIKDIFNLTCQKGDWIFPGATDASPGTPLDNSPFVVTEAQNIYMAKYFAGQTHPTSVFKLKFYTNKNINYMNWVGTNGDIPSSMKPQTTTIGYWRAVKQTSEETIVNKKEYNRVDRIMESVPQGISQTYKWRGSAWSW